MPFFMFKCDFNTLKSAIEELNDAPYVEILF